MTLTPALGALTQISTQTSGALARAAADSQSGAEAAVDTTIDLTLLFLGPIIGAVLGLVASVILSVLARKACAKSAMASSVLGRVRAPAHFALATWGAWVGLGIALVDPRLTDWGGSSVTTFLMHLLLIAGLACMTWMGYAAAWVFEDAAKARQAADRGRSRRFETRAQVLRRLVQVIVLLVGTVAMIGTFDAARQVMTTVLASAGVISVIFGLAAQQTLGNVFAGLQLAFTDAIRMGDVVVAGDKQETGSVEEITLSYVVVRIWDERRLIIPSRYFTQTPFENWTRRAAAQLGTVELKLDWSAPMTLIRAKVEKLLAATDLWDGRTWAVQITDSDAQTVTVRVLVSATNSGNLNDLRAYLREHLIAWIVAEEPWARPVQHIEPRATVTVEKDMSRERIARLAAELAGISGTNEAVAATGASSSHTGGAQRSSQDSALGGAASSVRAEGAVREQPKDAAHAARMVAARRKAKRIRRRAMADRQREMAEGQGPAPDETQVISKSALRKIIEAASNRNPQVTESLTTTSVGRGERLFSGSADADERAAALSGPGEEVFAEREANSRRVQDRREARERRHAAEAEAKDAEATTALAAVGVEPVEAHEASMPPAPEAEVPESAATAKSGPDKPTATSDEATKKAQNQSSSADSAAKLTEAAGEESHSAETVDPAPAQAETVDPAEADAPAEATQAAPEASEQSVSETAETPAGTGQAEADQAKDDQGKETEAQSEAPAATDEAATVEAAVVETEESDAAKGEAPAAAEPADKQAESAAAESAVSEVDTSESAPTESDFDEAVTASEESARDEKDEPAEAEPADEQAESAAEASAEAATAENEADETSEAEQAAPAQEAEDATSDDTLVEDPASKESETADDAAMETAAAPADGDEPEDATASSDTDDDTDAAAPSSEKEQATAPVGERETSVKQGDEASVERAENPVTTNMVYAGRPALVPPPAPTPAEMAASQEETSSDESGKPAQAPVPAQPTTPATPAQQEALAQSAAATTAEEPEAPAQETDKPAEESEKPAEAEGPDEPDIHPGWYAVAEEMRLEDEIRPTPTMVPPRVSIMDFFPAVAPTGAEAAMLRTVTGQVPILGLDKHGEGSGTDEAVAERPGTREAPCHESPTDEAAACGVISVPGGIRFAHVSGIAATSSCFHPRAFIDTVGVAPSEWMYPWSETKA